MISHAAGGASLTILVLAGLLATRLLFLASVTPVRHWNGQQVSDIEPENERFTEISLQLIRDRDEFGRSDPVLLFAHYMADESLTLASRER